MFSYNKTLAATVSFVLLAQQALFAFPTASALQRDAIRFKNLQQQGQPEEKVQLSPAMMVGLERFNEKTDSSYTVRVNAATGAARALVEGDNLSVGKTEGGALSFINSYKDLLGVDRASLKLKLKRQSPVGYHFYFEQYYKNLKVENAYVKVNTDKSGKLINYQSTYVKDLTLDIKPPITAQEASAIAAQDCSGTAEAAELVVYSDQSSSIALAWKIRTVGGAAEPGKWTYYINASTGEVINRISLVMSATETFNADIYTVYPGFGSNVKTTVPLRNMDVYYFSSGSTVARSVTNISGQVDITRTGRVFSAFSGPYFTVTNQRQQGGVTGYYVEQAKNGSVVEPVDVDFSAWTSFPKPTGTPTPTYNACSAGSWPVFTSPLIGADFSVGYMDNYGVISDKVFMKVTNPLLSNRVLGAYIGNPGEAVYGPAVPTASAAQTMGTALYPSGSSGTYTIDTLRKLCVPYDITSGYTALSSHKVTDMPNNNIPATAFYNLNEMRQFFVNLNAGNYVNLNNHIPVMVDAYGLPYTASGYNGMVNAFYDTDQKLIMFGEGEKVDGDFKPFALESAIVRHEYVHAVVDNIWPILYFGEGAAVSEALSDYFALSSLTDGSNNPYTSQIGKWVSVSASGGEGVSRDLNSASGLEAFNPVSWVANGINGQHKNSLVLSQALWDLRTNSATSAYADRLVWYSLMFFPDSLLEFRDAMISVAQAMSSTWGVNLTSQIATAFDNHNINFASIVTVNGDIYEPNNGPAAAADIDIVSIAKRQLNAKINPASDVDYYSVSLPEGNFEATLYLPKVENMSPDRYLAFGMFLLDANLKTVVDIVSPELSGGQYNINTASPSVKLNFAAPSRVNGNTGRYLIGVFKMDQGYYPATVTNDTGSYRLAFKFASGSNVGNLPTSVTNFNDGLQLTLTVPYETAVATSGSLPAALGLAEWMTNRVESLHMVRILDEDLTPITGADTITGTYLSLVGSPTYNAANKTITATVRFGNGFSALGKNTIYLQAFGKLRSNVAGTNPSYSTDYGIVSLGISNPLRNSVTSGKEIYIRQAVFNPATGSKIKIEIAPPVPGRIKVQIFTIDGLLVRTLKDGDINTALPDALEWDGTNESGNTVASGVYLLRIDGAGISKQLKKLVVVK